MLGIGAVNQVMVENLLLDTLADEFHLDAQDGSARWVSFALGVWGLRRYEMISLN